MNNGDRIRLKNNKELAEEIFKWHEILFGTEFIFSSDIEAFLDKEVEPRNIHEAAFDEIM